MNIESLGNIDIYLLDQLMKGRFSTHHKIIDVGCGKGRNMKYFIDNKYDISGMDMQENAIEHLKEEYPNLPLSIQNIENIREEDGAFDWVICIAVLHFAKNKSEFKSWLAELIRITKTNGMIFIRTASNIGIDNLAYVGNGVYNLPDGTTRFLLTMEIVQELLQEFAIKFIEPIKSVNVENQRSMTTLVIQKVN